MATLKNSNANATIPVTTIGLGTIKTSFRVDAAKNSLMLVWQLQDNGGKDAQLTYPNPMTTAELEAFGAFVTAAMDTAVAQASIPYLQRIVPGAVLSIE